MLKLNKNFIFKLNEEQEKQMDQTFSKHLKEMGEYFTKSEMVRRALEDYMMTESLVIREPTPDELYRSIISFIKELVCFLAEVKSYLLRMNGGHAIVPNPNDALMWKYFLSIITRADDAKLLAGNVYSLQTLAQIERALFESAIDLTLLNRGPLSNFDKMKAWDRFSLIKHARLAEKFVKDYNIDLKNPLYSSLEISVNHVADKTAVDMEIQQITNIIGNKKPKTWTGKGSLLENAETANKLRDYGFIRGYYSRIQILNMDTHGSGTAGLGTTDPKFFMGGCCLSYLHIIKWATVCYYETFHFLKKIDETHLIKLTNLYNKYYVGKVYPEIEKLILK